MGKFKHGYNDDSLGRELVDEKDYCAQRQINFISDQDRFFKYSDTENRCNPELEHMIFTFLGNSRDCTTRARGDSVQLRTPDFTYRVDFLETVKCINWPSGMKDWKFRRREYNWPDRQTIQFVMDTGCDVILTPNAEIMLSFTKAETVLIRSFTPVQQKVYHVMRCFAKAELFPAFSWLCAFHIKTLMFWSIERKPAEWWNDNNVVVICCQLLYDLYGMLCNRCCQHYFLPSYNLFRHYFQFRPRVREKNQSIFIQQRRYVHGLAFQQWTGRAKEICVVSFANNKDNS